MRVLLTIMVLIISLFVFVHSCGNLPSAEKQTTGKDRFEVVSQQVDGTGGQYYVLRDGTNGREYLIVRTTNSVAVTAIIK